MYKVKNIGTFKICILMIAKFLFDKIVSFVGIVLLIPIFITVTIFIWIKMSDGPAIFKQKRVGRLGKIFTMYKFRTMSIGFSNSTISIAGEKRITPLGSFLRKNKIDELPELWNVIKGDMSLVGPRPDVPGYADKLKGQDREILKLRPGITGPASLKFRNEEELLAKVDDPQKYNDEVLFPDKVRINLNYMKYRNFWIDIKIITYTVIGKNLEERYFN